MADSTSSEATSATEAASPEKGEGFTPITSQDALDKIIGARLAREQAKYENYDELKAKAAKLDELEEANKSERQKLAERAERAEAMLKEMEAKQQVTAWKEQVSKETGVPASVLAGSTLKEIKAHAEQLAPLLAENKAAKEPRTIIREREPEQPLALNSDALTESVMKLLGR